MAAMKRLTATAAITILLLAGCASEPSTPDGEVAQNEPESSTKKQEKRDDEKKKRGKRANGGESPEEASADGKRSKGAGAGEDRDEGDSTPDASDSGSAATYPAAGSYSFAQEGHEEFCDRAGRCQKEKLPARMPVDISYEERSSSSAVVITDQQASGSRRMRTWTRFESGGADITKVYVEFEYSGFRIERTYVPQPAVDALRFPLTAGESWSGEWKASTSGSYRVEVGRARELQIGGRTVRAFPVDTVTEFSGDFEGKSRIVAFIDPETKSIVAADGVLNITSQFGRYSTVFETKLVSGPGY